MAIKKRYFQVTEELLDAQPELLDPAIPSIDARLQAVAAALPELAAAATSKAIAEWGPPAGDITHLVVSTSSGAQMPGVDVRVASLLGLRATVRRTMIYFQACADGAGALRVAKDFSENNSSARVLVVCADVLNVMSLHAPDPDETRPEGVLAHAAPDPSGTPWSAPPGTERLIAGDFTAAGVGYSLAPLEVPGLVSYGNMVGPTVIFVLDEVVRSRRQHGGERCEWGVLVGLGPGFTAEVIVLRSLATPL